MGSTELEINEGIPLDQPMKDDLDEDIAKSIDELLNPPDLEKEVEELPEEKEVEQEKEVVEEVVEEEQPKQEAVKVEPEKKKRVEEIPAPESFSAEAKEAFYKFPKAIRKEVKKRYDDMHADYTRKTQEVAQVYNQAKPVIEIVNKYLPRWGKVGLTPESALSAILATNDQLVDPDPKVRKQAYSELFVNSGLSGQDFLDILEQAGSPLAEKYKTQTPQQAPLTEEEKRRQNWIDSQINAQYQQQVNTAVSEIQAVRDERDANGRYLWPRLHDQNVLEGQIKPLASTLIQQQSQYGQYLSWGDAVKRAYLALYPESATRLADKPNAQQTVRTSPTPRATGAMTRTATKASDIPDSIEDQIRMSIEELERGNY